MTIKFINPILQNLTKTVIKEENMSKKHKGSTTVTAATGTDTTEAEPAFGEKSICTASGNGTAGSAGRLCLRKNAHG